MILLTGATGYVGGRLLSALEQSGHAVRCLARYPNLLRSRVGPHTEVVSGDLLKENSLKDAFRGVSTAYYLVHSLAQANQFEAAEHQSASNFARACKGTSVERIVYLGGLGDSRQRLSQHLATRHQVGEILRQSGKSVLEFRASIIIGSGSLSFEMVRSLAERLPVMVTPRWVQTKAQPIAIEDVIAYLLAALSLKTSDSQIIEIGGADQVSYQDIMVEYARQRGLRRWMIPVPVLTPRLSSLWLGLVTPIYARVGRRLVESLRYSTIVLDPEPARQFLVRPRGLREAIERALVNEDTEFAHTRWSDALSSGGQEAAWGGVRLGARIVDSRGRHAQADLKEAFAPIRRIGGETGWYACTFLWRIRGFIDLCAGGVGLRRGRRDPERLQVGDALDFWRVENYEENHRLRLRAEMKLPGRAWLEFEVSPESNGSQIRQTAIFDPLGLAGLLYWYGLYPLHRYIFARMLERIVELAEAERSL